jgi:hypothetical protein
VIAIELISALASIDRRVLRPINDHINLTGVRPANNLIIRRGLQGGETDAGLIRVRYPNIPQSSRSVVDLSSSELEMSTHSVCDIT